MLTRQLKTAEVEMVAPLGHATVTLRDILNMKVGDVLPITLGDTVTAAVDGVPVIECRYGKQNGQVALRVERFLAEKQAEN